MPHVEISRRGWRIPRIAVGSSIRICLRTFVLHALGSILSSLSTRSSKSSSSISCTAGLIYLDVWQICRPSGVTSSTDTGAFPVNVEFNVFNSRNHPYRVRRATVSAARDNPARGGAAGTHPCFRSAAPARRRPRRAGGHAVAAALCARGKNRVSFKNWSRVLSLKLSTKRSALACIARCKAIRSCAQRTASRPGSRSVPSPSIVLEPIAITRPIADDHLGLTETVAQRRQSPRLTLHHKNCHLAWPVPYQSLSGLGL